MPPIQTDLIDLHSLLRAPLEWAMRKLDEARQPNWRGVSWRRAEATLLPLPARSPAVLLEDNTIRGLSTDHDAQSDLADALSNLERVHFAARSFVTHQDDEVIRVDAAGHFLCEGAWVTFWQHPSDKPARAEIVFPPNVSGHATFEALGRLYKTFPGLLAIPAL